MLLTFTTSTTLTNVFSSSSTSATTSKNQPTDVTEAELRWILHTVEKSKSFLCEDKSCSLFRAMFPDSAIAGKMTCGRSKQTYTFNFAIAPFCRQSQQEDLKGRCFSLAFDEADGRLGLVIRYIFQDGSLRTELLDIVPLEDFTSVAIMEVILEVVQKAKLPLRLWVSDSSDSCNAMRGTILSHSIG